MVGLAVEDSRLWSVMTLICFVGFCFVRLKVGPDNIIAATFFESSKLAVIIDAGGELNTRHWNESNYRAIRAERPRINFK